MQSRCSSQVALGGSSQGNWCRHVIQHSAITRVRPPPTEDLAGVSAMAVGVETNARFMNATRVTATTKALPLASRAPARVHAMMVGEEIIVNCMYALQVIATTMASPLEKKVLANALVILAGAEILVRSRHATQGIATTRALPAETKDIAHVSATMVLWAPHVHCRRATRPIVTTMVLPLEAKGFARVTAMVATAERTARSRGLRRRRLLRQHSFQRCRPLRRRWRPYKSQRRRRRLYPRMHPRRQRQNQPHHPRNCRPMRKCRNRLHVAGFAKTTGPMKQVAENGATPIVGVGPRTVIGTIALWTQLAVGLLRVPSAASPFRGMGKCTMCAPMTTTIEHGA